jgi:membrane-bound lytic murein transglycosylase D
MKIHRKIPVTVWSLLLAFLLAGCSAHPKPVETKIKPPAAKPGEKAESAKPESAETAPQAKPADLPALGKEDLNADLQGLPEKSEETEKEASALLEDGFAAYSDALAAIDRGDLDGALAKLDEAYEIIPKVRLPLDSPLLQEKNDLRVLIAQRIQQVYAMNQQFNVARLKTGSSINNSIPIVDNQWVRKEVDSFTGPEKGVFMDGYKRSGLYKDMIIEELHRAGLPEQLVWVPLIESWFKVRALSRARALGMWQFISSTGYRYGLKRDKYMDERMDPVKSTRAAIQHLSELHDIFGDWTTALAAYNCGEAYVQRVIRAQRINYLDNFWDLFNNLPWETARYVPRFIAALLIIKDPAKYGFELPEPDPPLKYETIRTSTPVKLVTLSQSLGLDPLILTVLNPELRFDSTPDYDYDLRVPEGYGEKCLACISTLPQYIPPDVVTDRYRVRRGDTLGGIARKYHTSVDAIVRLNGLRSRTLIREGQVLRIPVSGRAPSAAATSPPPGVKPGDSVIYIVQSGDTLFQLSKVFNTTVQKIKADNNLTSDDLLVGQRLVIQVGR